MAHQKNRTKKIRPIIFEIEHPGKNRYKINGTLDKRTLKKGKTKRTCLNCSSEFFIPKSQFNERKEFYLSCAKKGREDLSKFGLSKSLKREAKHYP